MTSQLTKTRKFVNGTSDLQGIGKRDLETPLTIDGAQFVVGSKSFVAPTRFYSDVSSGGFYYGDGSKLVNLPVVNDPSKLPLAGGTMTGALTMDSVPININGVSPAINVGWGTLTATLAITGLAFADNDIGFSSAFTESSVSLTSYNQTATLTAPLLQFVDNSNLSNFKFQTNTNFFKYDCGASYRIRQHDGQKVNKDDAIIVTAQSPSNYDFFNYDYYLDADGLGGFSFIIIHPGSVADPIINSPDILMVTRDYGPQNSFNLPKWSTARFILTPTDPAIGYPNNFVWMVSW